MIILNKRARLSGTWLLFLVFTGVIFLTSLVIIMAVTASSFTQARINSDAELSIKEPIDVEIVSPLEENGGIPVNIQDQTTTPFAVHMNRIINTNLSLALSPTPNTYNFTLNAGHNVTAGDPIAILEQDGIARIYFGKTISVSGNVITVDTPIPYAFSPTDSIVFTFDKEINADGSVTPITYGITNFFHESVDITRFIFHILDESAMDDSKFGSLPSLTKGITLRKQLIDGSYINYWNVKSNGKFAELAYDTKYDAKAPAGYYGFSSRLTYAGQEKHGVVIRLEPGERIEVVINDDLSDLYHFAITVEGHFVQN